MPWLRVFIDFTRITTFEELLKDCKHRYLLNLVLISMTTHTTRRHFLKLCSEYGVDEDAGKYRNKYFFSSWQEKRKYYDTPGLEYFY